MSLLRLAIEPIPAASRRATLAKLLPRDQWDRLRRDVYHQARCRCQVCGREGRLHCHEVWQFNQDTARQSLVGFQALCSDCHAAKHMHFGRQPVRRAALLRHFAAVNRLTTEQAEALLRVAQERQRQLNQQRWIVDYGAYNASVPCLRDFQHRRAFLRSSGRWRAPGSPSRTRAADDDSFWRADPDY